MTKDTGMAPPESRTNDETAGSGDGFRSWNTVVTVLAVVGFGLLTTACKREAAPSRTPAGAHSQASAWQVESPQLAWRPLPTAKSARESATRFVALPARETGIDFVNPLDADHPLRFLYHSGTSVGGVAIGDVDGDDRPDVFLASGPGPNKLYRQRAAFRFEDISESAGVGGGEAWGAGAALADVDNDGDLDLYVCNYDSPNQLFINSGDGTFAERAKQWRVDFVDASLLPSFCDYDRDGDLDFYLLTTRYHDPDGFPAGQPILQTVSGRTRIIPAKRKYWRPHFDGRGWEALPVATPDRLVANNGDGTFEDVTQTAGVAGGGDGLSATWWDYDDDGWPDLYVGNDFEDPDYLWRNNADGTFTNVIRETVPHTSWFSMGADAGDLDGDGRLDFLTADMSATSHFMEKTTMGAMGRKKWFLESAEPRQYMRNALYLNTGTPRFMEVAYLAGLADSDWTWSVKIADLDNDGRQDVYFTNGAARNSNDSDLKIDMSELRGKHLWDFYRNVPPRREQNLAFQNRGELQLEDVSARWGLDHTGMSYGAAFADLDRDGDLDMIVVNLDEPVSVYRNETRVGHRLLLRLVGANSNRWGLGATVRVRTPTTEHIRQLKSASGFLACDEPLLHFGLGAEQTIERLTVQWPSGAEQVFAKLEADRFYRLTEPIDQATSDASVANVKDASSNGASQRREQEDQDSAGEPMFVPSESLAGVRHKERTFDDFALQPLLPWKLSQLGPGLACGDVDGDGDDDLFIGGAAGEAGRLYVNQGNGQFSWSLDLGLLQPFHQDAACEDLAALFVDVDGDQTLDLFVSSGGVECPAGDTLLRDRLYLNDGAGLFTKMDGVLPDVRDSGAAAAAADFDRDGDVDLFVGGRVIPGQYPLVPSSRLLRNDGDALHDVTGELAVGLEKSGLVTSALWSDVDDDGWLDLLITHEWGPVKLYRNQGGTLVDATSQAGLAERLGWWNSIAGRDVDNDGDIDYVVLNFGFNTKYHASSEKPTLLYYGDFEGNGKKSLVEAEYEAEKLFPIRGRSCSSGAMPSLAERFTSYRDFALAELEDIYTQQCLADALRLECNTLDSGVLLNDGKGHFEFRPLPRLAQASPGFGVALTEINGDAYCDLYLVQNFFGPQVETGRMDGGIGVLLLGQGDGSFVPVPADQSGLVVPGDAKALAVTDINGDSQPDMLVARNDDSLLAFQRNERRDSKLLSVRLQAAGGAAVVCGARVTVHLHDGAQQTAELHAGGGYLSQSAPTLYFGLGKAAAAKSIEVRWPDGTTSAHASGGDTSTVTLRRPSP